MIVAEGALVKVVRHTEQRGRTIEKSTRGEKQRQLPRRPMMTLAVVMGELFNRPDKEVPRIELNGYRCYDRLAVLE